MTDVPPESRPLPPPEPDPARTHVLPPDQAPAAPKQRFVDRLWSFRALIAVALSSVILGGLAGAALGSVGDHDDARGGPMRFQRGGGPMGPPPGNGRQWRWGDGPGADGQQPGVNSPNGPLVPTPPKPSQAP